MFCFPLRYAAAFLVILACLPVGGCNHQEPQQVDVPSNQRSTDPAVDKYRRKITDLDDAIASLSISDAAALSQYLEVRHGITPAGEEADSKVPPNTFTPTIKALGDTIAPLSLTEADQLSDYLEEIHGIKPADF
jgi:hypothetical protein